jgi:hypothetical protein
MSSATSQPPPAEQRPLLFDWSRATGNWRTTGFWVLQIAVVLLAFSAVFRLRDTTQAHRLQRSHSILLLDSGTDAVEPMLDRAADVSYLALGSGLGLQMEAEIAKGLPKFHPSFQDATLSIKARPEDSPKPKQPTSENSSGLLHWQAAGELAARGTVKPKSVPAALASVAGGLSFHVGVDAGGVVRFALPLDPVNLSPADLAALRKTVEELRFSPAPGADLRWDSLSLKPFPTSP